MRILIVCYERILPAGCTFNSFLRSSSVPLNHVINTFMQYTPFQSLHLVYIAKADEIHHPDGGVPALSIVPTQSPRFTASLPVSNRLQFLGRNHHELVAYREIQDSNSMDWGCGANAKTVRISAGRLRMLFACVATNPQEGDL